MVYKAAFIGFALLIAARDILSELWLIEEPITIAFIVCLTIALVSLIGVTLQGNFLEFVTKTLRRNVIIKAALLSFLSAVVYGVTFFMLKTIGAGLFDLIDYGLAPLLTALIGIFFFSDKLKPDLIFAGIIYLCGIFFLTLNKPLFGWQWLLVAVLSPVATASADGMTKWMLAPQGGGFSRLEVLVIRFLPASIFLLFVDLLFSGDGVQVAEWPKLMVVSLFCGFLPLYLLCTALGKRALTELAMWEFLIPGLAFFGTLHAHLDDHAKLLPITGAILVLAGMIVGETGFISRLFKKTTSKSA